MTWPPVTHQDVQDAVIARSVIADVGTPGTATGNALGATYVPQAPLGLRRFYAALGNRQQAGAAVWCIGDSITEAEGVTNLDQGWVNLLRDQLRRTYVVPWAAGGAGFVPPYTYSSAPSGVTLAGSPATGSFFGPGAKVVILNGTKSATYTVFGTSVDVLYARGSGVLSVTVDGGAPVTQSAAGTQLDGQAFRVTFGSRTTHTVVVTSASSDLYHTGIVVYDQDELAGIHIYNGGRSGWSSNDYLTQLSSTTIGQLATGIQPALVIYSLGVNDFLHSEGSASLTTNTGTILSTIRAGCTISPSILIHIMYPATFTGGTAPEPWDNFAQALRNYAAAHTDCAVLDQTLRMPAVAGDTLGIYNDPYHPNVIGHQMIADSNTGFLRAR